MAVTSQSTLKELVDETGLIKNELVSCRDNLKTNLSNKGVDVSGLNKMDELIKKVNDKLEVNIFPAWREPGDVWVEGATPTMVQRSYCSSSALGDSVYITGGVRSGIHKQTECYNTLDNTITFKAPLLTAVRNSCMETVNDKIYVISGDSGDYAPTKYLQNYDSITDTWSYKQSILYGVKNASSCVIGNFIYVFGGYGNTTDYKVDVTKHAQCYDTVLNTWTSKKEMPWTSTQSACSSFENVAYIVGGITELDNLSTATNRILRYYPATDTWNTDLRMTNYLTQACVEIVNKKLYIFGGIKPPDYNIRIPNTECYDLLLNTIEQKQSSQGTTVGVTSTVVNDKVYIINPAYTQEIKIYIC